MKTIHRDDRLQNAEKTGRCTVGKWDTEIRLCLYLPTAHLPVIKREGLHTNGTAVNTDIY